MRNFDLHAEYDSVISNSNIINLISKIHEYKGEQPYLLETQKDTLKMKKSTAYDRISNLFKNNIIPLDKNYISNKCPDISITTIERVLSKLVKENKIIKISMGRFTKYKWQNND